MKVSSPNESLEPNCRGILALATEQQFRCCFYAPCSRSAAVAHFNRYTARHAMRFLTIILFLALVGCGRREGLPVEFVVPDGYRGVFSVTLDPATGSAVPVTNGQFVLSIPSAGKLRISSWDCIGGRHVVSARYASGGALPPGHDENAISLRAVTFNPDTKTAVYLIGTQREASDAFTKY
jgi:hypothetical protein